LAYIARVFVIEDCMCLYLHVYMLQLLW